MKFCFGKCQKELDDDKFYTLKGVRTSWLSSHCKSCQCDLILERRRELKRRAVAYMGGRCKDCGLVDVPEVYDFHHTDPTKKEFTIGKYPRSWKVVQPELDKCILLCANCHRKCTAASRHRSRHGSQALK